jgi:eukaryotic-like serine/threonine-protein kinase
MSTPTTVPSTPTIEPGRLVGGRYVLLAPVGRGGSGSVWRAHDQLLDREVAVKRLRGGPALDAVRERMVRERAHREGRVAARLHHPRLAAIYDMTELDGEVCLVMEYLDSPSLADLLRREGPLSAARVAAIGAQIAEGLGAMHGRGIVHRDIKPANIMVGPDDTVTVTDFGIAVIDAELGAGGHLFAGTPGYMAPELARREPPSAAADLFSLGATLYTALVGTPPPSGGDPALEFTAAGVRPPTHATERLGQALRALLDQDPQRRPSATAAARLLTAAAERTTGPAKRSSAAERSNPPVGAQTRTEIAIDRDAAPSRPLPSIGVPALVGRGSPATPGHRAAPGHPGGRHRAVLAASRRPSRRVVGVVAGLAGVLGAAGLVTLAAEPRQEPPRASPAAPLATPPLPAAGPPIVPAPSSRGTSTSVEEVASASAPRSETSRDTAAQASLSEGDDSGIGDEAGGDDNEDGGGGDPNGHGNGNGNGHGRGHGRGHGG